MIQAQDIMSKNPLLVNHTTTVQQAAMLMQEHNVGSLLISKNKYPVGIITETDLTQKVVAQNLSHNTSVQEIMSSPLYYSSPEADVLEVAAAMNINNIKKVPVITGNSVFGVITQTDIIQHLFSLFRQMHEAFAQGRLSREEFVEKSSDIVQNLEQAALNAGRKNWHMTCVDCKNKFLNPETDEGLRYNTCPSCHSKNISYDEV